MPAPVVAEVVVEPVCAAVVVEPGFEEPDCVGVVLPMDVVGVPTEDPWFRVDPVGALEVVPVLLPLLTGVEVGELVVFDVDGEDGLDGLADPDCGCCDC